MTPVGRGDPGALEHSVWFLGDRGAEWGQSPANIHKALPVHAPCGRDENVGCGGRVSGPHGDGCSSVKHHAGSLRASDQHLFAAR
jgi:hypothetical protein